MVVSLKNFSPNLMKYLSIKFSFVNFLNKFMEYFLNNLLYSVCYFSQLTSDTVDVTEIN